MGRCNLRKSDRTPGKALADQIELIECLVPDRDGPGPRIRIGVDRYLEPQKFLQMSLDRGDIGGFAR